MLVLGAELGGRGRVGSVKALAGLLVARSEENAAQPWRKAKPAEVGFQSIEAELSEPPPVATTGGRGLLRMHATARCTIWADIALLGVLRLIRWRSVLVVRQGGVNITRDAPAATPCGCHK